MCYFFAIGLYGQEWSLFPENQRSFYEISSNNQQLWVDSFMTDSVRQSNDSVWFYFNSKLSGNFCIDLQTMKRYDNYYSFSGPLFADSGYTFADTSWVFFKVNDDLYRCKFALNAKPGDSWFLLDSMITIRCDSLVQDEIFGQADSIKYFSIDNVTVKSSRSISFALSKHFGLLNFIPFYQLISSWSFSASIESLMGCQIDSVVYGSVIPEFKDFFHLSANDVIYWLYDSEPDDIFQPSESYYFKDSIIGVFKTDDSVVYDFVSFYNNAWGEVQRKVYRKDDYQNFLKMNSNSGTFATGVPFDYYSEGDDGLLHWQADDLIMRDTLTSIDFIYEGISLSTSECELVSIYDVGLSFRLDTRFGISEYCTMGWGFLCHTVVGAVIDGKKWGKTSLPSDITERKNDPFVIYPNPCNEILTVKINVGGTFYFRITDINGRVIKQNRFENSGINMDDVNPGIYYFELFNERTHYSQVIVKGSTY